MCGKYLRSDKLKHHMETKHESETSGEMVVQSSKEILERELYENNEAYVKNVAIGEEISTILSEGVIMEKSLSKQHKLCLELYRSQQPSVDVENVELRLWQEQLLDIIDEGGSDRKIIWVKGKDGNEGKSWFQSYLQSLRGVHRVARLTLPTSPLIYYTS